jgi:hypothetical protein
LWELLPVFEYILNHFEILEQQAKDGKFKDNHRIQNSITLAWNKTQEYYTKTDASTAWMAALVLHPRWKWAYFQNKWTGSEARFVEPGKKKLKKLWETSYKKENPSTGRAERSPTPEKTSSFLEDILDEMAPTAKQKVAKPTARRDQLFCYLEEPPIGDIGVMEYWRTRENDWPQLASMAYDFLAIPAMSSECERVFSSCAKQTTPESSKLSGLMLWHQECLKNWQRRGAISIQKCWNAILLDL